MVAQPKIRCAVVAITAENNDMNDTLPQHLQPRFRPSDLLPWADPYIAGLVRKLQAEIRSEREPSAVSDDIATLRAELELPWPGTEDSAEDRADETPVLEVERRIRETESVGTIG